MKGWLEISPINIGVDFNGESFLLFFSLYNKTWWNPLKQIFSLSGRRAYLTFQVNQVQSISAFHLRFAVPPCHDEAGEQLCGAMSKRHIEDQWQQNGPKFHFILWVSWQAKTKIEDKEGSENDMFDGKA